MDIDRLQFGSEVRGEVVVIEVLMPQGGSTRELRAETITDIYPLTRGT
jgi:hypothetical protein